MNTGERKILPNCNMFSFSLSIKYLVKSQSILHTRCCKPQSPASNLQTFSPATILCYRVGTMHQHTSGPLHSNMKRASSIRNHLEMLQQHLQAHTVFTAFKCECQAHPWSLLIQPWRLEALFTPGDSVVNAHLNLEHSPAKTVIQWCGHTKLSVPLAESHKVLDAHGCKPWITN